jgi:hypothetical protein
MGAEKGKGEKESVKAILPVTDPHGDDEEKKRRSRQRKF